MDGSRADAERLLEAATSAYREHDRHGRILPSPDWADLSVERRAELFERTLAARRLEAAADPNLLTSTARAVLARLDALPQLG